MTKLHDVFKLGQAIWYDNISRALIQSGELQGLLDKGVRGVTSNPTIFDKAISGSSDYDDAIAALATAGKSVEEIYQALTTEDIQAAADLLYPLYESCQCQDGYVSLEVSPALAHDTEGTVAEARRLFATLKRPNVMIKVPATPAGIPAIQTLISEGINVNVTLMFSLKHYDAVAEAYIAGLERFVVGGGDPSRVTSVASFFVSRVETAVDKALEVVNSPEALSLKGDIAIANTKVTYARFKETFSGVRWQKLAEVGAQVQRPLWASTGTKNPNYPDTIYVDSLIGAATVNTVPPATLKAFMDHGTAAAMLAQNVPGAQAQLDALSRLGIDLNGITQKLQDDGVASFANSFASLMNSIAEKRMLLSALEQA